MQARKMFPAWFEVVFFTVILVVSLSLTWHFHKKFGYFNWKSEIWADRAGYYVFLPATFYYHWDLKKAPPNMDEKTGYGFVYDTKHNTISTKYSCGLAFPLAPFFITVHYIAKIFGIPRDDGFAPIFHHMVNVAAVIYLVLGLFFLFRFLRHYFSEPASYLGIFFLFAGTNLFYYAIADTLMAHVYNFFLVALYLFSLKKYLENPARYRYFIIACMALALVMLIRPTSLLLIVLFFLLDVRSLDELKARLAMMFRAKHLPVLVLILIIGYIPQLLYNHYVSGQFIRYLYDDSFANLFAPRLLEVWFSTMNGLFIYTPLMILFIAGMIMMVRQKATNAWISIILFLVYSYVFASWTCWYFGCAFGQRSFIDLFPVFAIPFTFLIENSIPGKRWLRTGLIAFLLLLFSWYNISLSHAHEECFFGSTWDWNRYGQLLNKAKILPFKPGFAYINDYENAAICNGGETTSLISRSGNHSLVFNPNHEFNGYFVEYPTNMVRDSVMKRLKIKLFLFKTSNTPTGALIVCSAEKDGKNLFWSSRPVDVPMSRTRQWYAVPVNFDIPKDLDPWAEVKVYIWNKEKITFYIDDLEINAE
jgi:hypothetical protein